MNSFRPIVVGAVTILLGVTLAACRDATPVATSPTSSVAAAEPTSAAIADNAIATSPATGTTVVNDTATAQPGNTTVGAAAADTKTAQAAPHAVSTASGTPGTLSQPQRDLATMIPTAPAGSNEYGTPFPTYAPTKSFATHAQQFFQSRFEDAGIRVQSHECAADSPFANYDICKKQVGHVTQVGWVAINYFAGPDDCSTVNWVVGDFESFASIVFKQIPDIGAFELIAWMTFQQSPNETDYRGREVVPGAPLSLTGASRVITRGVDIEPALQFSVSRATADAMNWDSMTAPDMAKMVQPTVCPCPDDDTWVDFNYQILGPWGAFKQGKCS
jgi:hypothetical protein